MVAVLGVKSMQRRPHQRRQSQIANPIINFVLTGTGVALEFQHCILVFLVGDQGAWTLDLLSLNRTSVHLYRVTITWRQVDTPSVASVASAVSFHLPSSDDEF